MNSQEQIKLVIQALVGLWLVIGLAFHLAAVGLIGLTVIILCTSACGITSEHALGKAFQESLPFTALLVVFFSVVAVIVIDSGVGECGKRSIIGNLLRLGLR